MSATRETMSTSKREREGDSLAERDEKKQKTLEGGASSSTTSATRETMSGKREREREGDLLAEPVAKRQETLDEGASSSSTRTSREYTYDAFLAHGSYDASFMDRVHSLMEDGGMRPFLDKKDWFGTPCSSMEDVYPLIDASRVVVVSVSEYLIASGFAMAEVHYALEQTRCIVPVFKAPYMSFDRVLGWGNDGSEDAVAAFMDLVTDRVDQKQAAAWLGDLVGLCGGDVGRAKDLARDHTSMLPEVVAWRASRRERIELVFQLTTWGSVKGETNSLDLVPNKVVDAVARVLRDQFGVVRHAVSVRFAPGKVTDNYVVPSAQYEELVERVLRGGASGLTAVRGLGGVGKSELARAVAADPRVRAEFSRILWISVGEDRESDSLLAVVQDLIKDELGGDASWVKNKRELKRAMSAALERAEGRVLLIFDDVWTLEQYQLLSSGVKKPHSVLVTTRDSDCLPRGAEPLTLELLDEGAAMSVFLKNLAEGWEDWEGGAVPGADDERVKELVAGRRGHALGLEILGRAINCEDDLEEMADEALVADVTEEERENDETGALVYGDVFLVMEAVLRRLGDVERAAYAVCGLFPTDTDIKVDWVVNLLVVGGMEEEGRKLRKKVQGLAKRALLREKRGKVLELHDLAVEYLKTRVLAGKAKAVDVLTMALPAAQVLVGREVKLPDEARDETAKLVGRALRLEDDEVVVGDAGIFAFLMRSLKLDGPGRVALLALKVLKKEVQETELCDGVSECILDGLVAAVEASQPSKVAKAEDVVLRSRRVLDLSEKAETLTDAELDEVLGGYRHARRVILTGCTGVTDDGVQMVLDTCAELENVDVSGCSIGDKMQMMMLQRSGLTFVDRGRTSLAIGKTEISSSLVRRVAGVYPELQSLSLKESWFSAGLELADVLRHYPSLTSLDLKGCRWITGVAVLALAERCTSLTSLDLRDCSKITDEAMVTLAERCTSLKSLALGDCDKITDKAVLALAKHCTSLTSFDLVGCYEITDEAMTTLAEHCTSLTSLNLKGCSKITDKAVTAVAERCTSLTSLNLGGCSEITDGAMTTLAQHCTSLTSLNLEGCSKITDEAVVALAEHCTSITSINLWGCSEITDEAVLALAEHCTSLTFLDLGRRSLSDGAVLTLAKHSTLLTSLNLGGHSKITDEAVVVLAEHCPSLTDLNLQGCSKITNKAVIALAERCTSLMSLNLSFCPKVTDEAVVALAGYCTSLTDLSLSFCSEITDEAVVALARHCTSLASLDLWGCSNITDEAVAALAEGCTSLTSLNLGRCSNITDEAVVALAQRCTSLAFLNLDGCYKITDEAVATLAELLHNLRILR